MLFTNFATLLNEAVVEIGEKINGEKMEGELTKYSNSQISRFARGSNVNNFTSQLYTCFNDF